MKNLLLIIGLLLTSCVSTENRPQIVNDQFQFDSTLGVSQKKILKGLQPGLVIEQGKNHRKLPHYYARTANRKFVVEMYGKKNDVKLASYKMFLNRSDPWPKNLFEFEIFVRNIAPACRNKCIDKIFYSNRKKYADTTVYDANRKFYFDYDSRSDSLSVTVTPETRKSTISTNYSSKTNNRETLRYESKKGQHTIFSACLHQTTGLPKLGFGATKKYKFNPRSCGQLKCSPQNTRCKESGKPQLVKKAWNYRKEVLAKEKQEKQTVLACNKGSGLDCIKVIQKGRYSANHKNTIARICQMKKDFVCSRQPHGLTAKQVKKQRLYPKALYTVDTFAAKLKFRTGDPSLFIYQKRQSKLPAPKARYGTNYSFDLDKSPKNL